MRQILILYLVNNKCNSSKLNQFNTILVKVFLVVSSRLFHRYDKDSLNKGQFFIIFKAYAVSLTIYANYGLDLLETNLANI